MPQVGKWSLSRVCGSHTHWQSGWAGELTYGATMSRPVCFFASRLHNSNFDRVKEKKGDSLFPAYKKLLRQLTAPIGIVDPPATSAIYLRIWLLPLVLSLHNGPLFI